MIDESCRSKVDDVVVGSVWRFGLSLELRVVTGITDGWVELRYLSGNNGMTRTGDLYMPDFLSHYILFYTPKNS